MTTTENNRFNEVNNKLKDLYKKADENGKDGLVKQMKTWLKVNHKTTDKPKKEAIQSFLADINIF